MSDIDINQIIPWIPIVGALVAVYFAFMNSRRADGHDVASNAKALTRIETTLGSVRDGVDDIRIEVRTQQKQISEMSERVARVEESAKSAHRRIDGVKGE